MIIVMEFDDETNMNDEVTVKMIIIKMVLL
jgi:hypothetical protein